MGRKGKTLIITIVLVVALGILVKPYIFPKEKNFAITPEPYQVYQQAVKQGRPIFLEFYATW